MSIGNVKTLGELVGESKDTLDLLLAIPVAFAVMLHIPSID